MPSSRPQLASLLLLATIVTSTWTKLYWEPAGKLGISTILALAFIGVVGANVIAGWLPHIPRGARIAAVFCAAFTAVFCAGALTAETRLHYVQFSKGFITWLIAAAFMLCAALYVSERGSEYVKRCAVMFVLGGAINAGYGLMQLVVLGFGTNLDEVVLEPLAFSVGGTRGIQLVATGIYRINGLMRDTNHFGVMLVAMLPFAIIVLQRYARIAATLVLGSALIISLSRSGWFGAVFAALVLAWLHRRRINIPIVAGVAASAALVITAVAISFPEMWAQIVASRLDLADGSAMTHVRLYTVVPQMMEAHPLVGSGLNSFAIGFEEISGRTEFGPHSLYIQYAVEAGIVGIMLFVAFAAFLYREALRVTAAGSTQPALGVAICAALVGTWAGNVFYLTGQMLYVYVLYSLALGAAATRGGSAQVAADSGGVSPRATNMDDSAAHAHAGTHEIGT